MKSIIQALANRFGYEIKRKREIPFAVSAATPYLENPEAGPVNLKEKLARASAGGHFEWPDIVALNQTVASLVGQAKRIVELGGGTGAFAWNVSQNDQVTVTCSEFDEQALAWAIENRSRPNIRYVNTPVSVSDGPFDLLVAIEVIEHVQDYVGFLEMSSLLAPKAIFTTPNRNRNRESYLVSPPRYYQHVREWTAGEFYWVLRTFYEKVALLAMPDPYKVGAIPISIVDTATPLIAICEQTIRRGKAAPNRG